MSTTHMRMPLEELALRHKKCREILAARLPEASGILVFSPVNIYYLSGTLAFFSVLWFPLSGEPVLMTRRGMDRALLESPLKNIASYRTYGDISKICAQAGSPLGSKIGVEKGGLSWSMAEKLCEKLNSLCLLDATAVLARTRAVKTPYELAELYEGGKRHHEALEAMAGQIRPGMSEREMAHIAWGEFIKRDHAGIMRVTALEGENFFGQLAAGPVANLPFYNDGTIGYIGTHAAAPYFGSRTIWQAGTLLVTDFAFCWNGYYTDKTRVFWGGKPASVPSKVRRAQDVCMDIESRCAAMLQPGVFPAQIWRLAKENIDKAGFSEQFMGLSARRPRFVGHGIGLVSDEFPAIAEGFEEPLESGMVMAIEPKICFADYGVAGVENIFEVTASGGVLVSGTTCDLLCIE